MRLAHHAFQRRAGGGVEFFGHATGEVSGSAGHDGVIHGFGHQHGIFSMSDPGIHEHTVGTELHGDGGVGGGAYSGIHDERDAGNHLAQNAQIGGVLNFQRSEERRVGEEC